jgi:3',5'-nucleoside bisphosphate phosphatase
MRADLHTHSDASDGTDSPADVMRRAWLAGLDAVALTDHDTVAGWEQARQELQKGDSRGQGRWVGRGLTLVPGMELSCRVGERSMHLLAYLFDPGHAELAEQTRLIRDDRILRARAMVGRLAALGVPVTWEQVAAIAGTAVVGRPHIARAMAASGAIAEPGEAFTDDWIGDGGRAYVGRYALDPVHATGLIRAAGGVAVLAHPRAAGRPWSDEQIAALAATGLAGVEVFHPDQPESARAGLLGLAGDLGLVATGGSDDHGSLTGYRIGSEVAPTGAYETLVAMATGTHPVTRGLRGAVLGLDAQFAEQVPQPADLLADRVKPLGQGGKVGVRGGPLRVARGFLGAQLPFPVAQGSRVLVILGPGGRFFTAPRLLDLPFEVADLRPGTHALLDGGQLGNDEPDAFADLSTYPAHLPPGPARTSRGAFPLLVLVYQLDHPLAHPVQVSTHVHQHLGRDPVALADEAEQDVLGADVVVAHGQRLTQRELEHLLGPRRNRDVPGRRPLAVTDDLLDLLPHGVQADPQRLERLGRDTSALVDEAEQDVLGADVVVVEHPGFVLSQVDDPPCPVAEALEHPPRHPSPHLR